MRKPGSKNQPALYFLLRAFRHRNYRLFFGGQGVSLIGTWMQQIAISWMVYRLTNSALLLGLIGFAGQFPSFLLSSLAGVMADRKNKLHLLIVLQTLAMIQAFILAFLTLSDRIMIWHLFALTIGLGMVNAFEIPTRQSFVIEMLDRKEDLGNAIALNSFMFNSARLVGPSVAGLLIGLMGEGVCFLLNAISFVAILGALVAMRIPKRKRPVQTTPVWHGLREGFRYAFGFAPIRYMLLLLALFSLMGTPYLVLMPVFARDVLHGGPHTLGFLMGASGIGALLGALFLASRKTVLGLGRLIGVATGIFGCILIAFALSKDLPLSLLLMAGLGFCMILVMASTNTILQTIVEEDKRGRIMSLYVMSLMGMGPFGALLSGTVAHRLGAPDALIIGGVCCIAGSFLFLFKLPRFRRKVRPIYMRMGIIEEMPTELH